MKKLLLLLVFCTGFIACSTPTDCCVPPPEPFETAISIVKDWEPREAVQIEGSIFTMGQDAASIFPMKIPQQYGRNMKWIVLLNPAVAQNLKKGSNYLP